MLLWATLLNCAVAMAFSLRAGLANGWGTFLQHALLAALALWADRSHSESAALVAFFLALCLLPAAKFVRRRTLHFVTAGDVARARLWNRFTRVLLWGAPGAHWHRLIELHCRHREGAADAAATLETLGEIPPGTLAAVEALRTARETRQWEAAAELYRNLPSALPLPSSSHVLGARVLLRAGFFEDAAEAMQRATSSPGRGAALFVANEARIASTLLGAMSAVEFWSRIVPPADRVRELHTRGLALARAGHKDEARVCWEAASAEADSEMRSVLDADLADLEKTWVVPAAPAAAVQRAFRQLYLRSALAEARLGFWGRALLIGLLLSFALQPARWANTGYLSLAALQEGAWWRLGSYLFTHANWAHVLLNSVGLAFTAPWVEMLYGRRMLLVFFCSGLVAAVVQLYLAPQIFLIGASGAVFGLYGACAAAVIRMKSLPARGRRRRLQTIAAGMVLQVLADHLIPHVAGAAHLAGFVAGLVVGLLLPWSSRTAPGQLLRLPEQPA
jgi:membrane associated rhomboid family serine protease